MLTSLRSRALVLVVLSASLLLAACGGDGDGAKVSGTTKSGTELSSSGAELPKGWPDALTAPEGAEVTSVLGENGVSTVSGTSSEGPMELAAQFKQALEGDGWTMTKQSGDDNSINVEDWELDGATAQVSSISAADGATFTIIYRAG